MSFWGEYKHTIDKKNRMALPARIRDDIGEKIYIFKSFSATKFINVYPSEEWEKLEEKLNTMTETGGAEIRRRVFSSLAIVECDAQGRILIPQNLAEYAGMIKDTVVLGVGKHAEIWSAENREAAIAAEDSEEIFRKLTELGF